MNRASRLFRLAPLALALAPMIVQATPQTTDTASELAFLKQRIEQLEARLQAQAESQAQTQSTLQSVSTQVASQTARSEAAARTSLGDTKVSISGYVKLDTMMSRYSDGEVASGSTGRDFYVPGATPVSDGSGRSSQVYDMHAKQTRLILKTETPGGAAGPVRSHIELDFQSPARGTERVTNNYDPGLRHAFLTYGNWLFGQTWTTFQDLGALPETVDFVGAADGTVFARQPQIRYSTGNWQFAAENAQTAVTSTAAAITDTGDNRLPDLVARYTWKGDFGHLSIAALARQLKTSDTVVSDTAEGFGVSLSGKFKVGSADDIRFMLTHGSGIGRYIALATAGDTAITNGELDLIDVTAGYVSYRHPWSDRLRSTFQFSGLNIDNPASAGNATEKVYSGLANMLYSITPKLELGLEYLHAKRQVENGDDGTLDRLQFTAKHSF